MPSATSEGRILILAPKGRDAFVIEQVLAHGGLPCQTCSTLNQLTAELGDGAAMAIVTEESLTMPELRPLSDWLRAQPAWSDFPLIVLATRQTGPRSPQALERLQQLGNVILLERPLNSETLLSAASSAFRARRRQYESRRHLEEAEHANRIKDEFLATLSHELRTPLSAILGWVHLLRRRNFAQAEAERALETIERNARTQARLIEELLDMSRIISGAVHLETAVVGLGPLVQSVVASLQPVADARAIVFDTEIDPATPSVAGDPHRLQQVVWNILSNAIKFSPRGGRVEVKLVRSNKFAELSVKDHGEGIAPEFLPHVFERFRQADSSATRAHGGLGLGLAIVRNLVELHGGSVHAKSKGVGQGSTFTVCLPRVSRALAPPGLEVETSGPMPLEPMDTTRRWDFSGLVVVVVDDEVDSRELVRAVLEEVHATVQTAGSANEALVLLQSLRADLLISDIAMPQVDGHELLRRIRASADPATSRTPAIALTAFARAEDRRKALEVGFASHLSKPIEANELLAEVAAVCGRPAVSAAA